MNKVARWQNLIPSAWVVGRGRNPRKGRAQILERSGAIVLQAIRIKRLQSESKNKFGYSHLATTLENGERFAGRPDRAALRRIPRPPRLPGDARLALRRRHRRRRQQRQHGALLRRHPRPHGRHRVPRGRGRKLHGAGQEGQEVLNKLDLLIQSVPVIWSSDTWSFRPYGQISVGTIC